MRIHVLLPTALLLFGALEPSAAPLRADCTPHLVGVDRRGPARAVAKAGDIVYLGSGAALQAFDVADPWHPRRLATLHLETSIRGIVVTGATALVLQDRSLDFVDVSDPQRLRRLGSYRLAYPEWAIDVDVAGHHALLPIYDADRVAVIDFADPTRPIEAASLPFAYPVNVLVRGGLAYLSGADHIAVLDVANPLAPEQIGLLEGTGGDLALSPSGTKLVVFGGGCYPHHDCGWAIWVDVADPRHPVRRGMALHGDTIESAAVAGGLAFLAEPGPGRIWVYDIADLSAPSLRGSFAATALQMALDSPLLFAAAGSDGMRVFRLLDPVQPQEIAHLLVPGIFRSGFVAGARALVAHDRGLRTYDLADPRHPRVVGSRRVEPFDYAQVKRLGDFAWVAVSDAPIQVFDIHEIERPRPVGTVGVELDFPLVVEGDRAYVWNTFRDPPLGIWDVSDPTAPEVLGGLGEPWWSLDGFAAQGELALVADSGALWAYDVSDPAAPVQLSIVDDFVGRSLVLRGDRLVFADRGLSIWDVADPVAPLPLHHLPVEGWPGHLTMYGGRAFLTEAGDGWGPGHIFVVDIRGGVPTLVHSFAAAGRTTAAFVGPGVLVALDAGTGLSVYETCVPFADGFETGDTSEWSARELQ